MKRHLCMGWPLTDDRLRMEHGRLMARIRKLDRKSSPRKVQLVAMCVLELIVVERIQNADVGVRAILEEDSPRGKRARAVLRSIQKDELMERSARLSPGSGIILPERRGVREDVEQVGGVVLPPGVRL